MEASSALPAYPVIPRSPHSTLHVEWDTLGWVPKVTERLHPDIIRIECKDEWRESICCTTASRSRSPPPQQIAPSDRTPRDDPLGAYCNWRGSLSSASSAQSDPSQAGHSRQTSGGEA